jgi:hypothetical protein
VRGFEVKIKNTQRILGESIIIEACRYFKYIMVLAVSSLFNTIFLLKCGFNAGDGTTYFSITGSNMSTVLTLPVHSNIGKRGVWVFKIDNAVIEEGGCNTEGNYFTYIFPKKTS